MPTVLRERGYRFIINTNDHPPAHVHIWNQGNWVIVEFENGVFVRDNQGLNRREIAIAELIVEDNVEFLLSEWRKIHG